MGWWVDKECESKLCEWRRGGREGGSGGEEEVAVGLLGDKRLAIGQQCSL